MWQLSHEQIEQKLKKNSKTILNFFIKNNSLKMIKIRRIKKFKKLKVAFKKVPYTAYKNVFQEYTQSVYSINFFNQILYILNQKMIHSGTSLWEIEYFSGIYYLKK